MSGLLAVTRQALRSLLLRPSFTIVAVLTLGLGIGAVTAIYAILDSVALRPLPYPRAERLVWLESIIPRSNPDDAWGLSEAGYYHFRERTRSLAEIAALGSAFEREYLTLPGAEEPLRVPAAAVSANALPLLGATPALGRLFDERDDVPGAPRVIVLGHELWRAEFGGDRDVVGRTISVEGAPHDVIGVMAAGVHLPTTRVSAWVPLRLDPGKPPENDHWVSALGLLAPGATLDDAQRELAQLTAGFPEALPGAYSQAWMERQGFATRVVTLREHVLGGTTRLLWTLLASVALVLLIALANVFGLFMVRGEARRRESAIRVALGASTAGLLRQPLAESLLVGAAATLLALAFAAAGLRLFTGAAPDVLPRLAEVSIGAPSLVFAALLGLLSSVILGSAPALWSRGSAADLRDGGRQTASRQRNRVRGALIVAQVGLALVLLTSAALLLRSFQQLRSVASGFDARDVLTLQVVLPRAGYSDPDAAARFYAGLVDRVEALPGVVRAGAATWLPTVAKSGCYEIMYAPGPAAETARPCIALAMNTPGWFEALQIPVQGQTPDRVAAERGGEVVITRALADRLWPGEDPIGREVWGFWWGDAPRYRVAGVAGDLRLDGLDRAPAQAVFLPPRPAPGGAHWGPWWGEHRELFLFVRSATGAPQALAPAIRGIVGEAEPQAAVVNVRTLEHVMATSASMARVSLLLVLLGLAGSMALFLSAVGLYGVVSYVVSQRTQEIGLRMALGARSAQVAGAVLRQALQLALAGVAGGWIVVVLAGRAVEALLFEVEATDTLAVAAASLVLLLVAAGAALLPALRATRVSPLAALRSD
jgi:putative ABC transport system permease protein